MKNYLRGLCKVKRRYYVSTLKEVKQRDGKLSKKYRIKALESISFIMENSSQDLGLKGQLKYRNLKSLWAIALYLIPLLL